EPREAAGLHAESCGAHQRESGDARGPLHGEGLRDAAAESVADDERLVDAEVVEQGADGGRVGAASGARGAGWIAAAESGKVDDNLSMPGCEVPDEIVPEARRHGESMDEHHRFAGAAGTGRIVIEA